jgi:hypothetical protein
MRERSKECARGLRGTVGSRQSEFDIAHGFGSLRICSSFVRANIEEVLLILCNDTVLSDYLVIVL